MSAKKPVSQARLIESAPPLEVDDVGDVRFQLIDGQADLIHAVAITDSVVLFDGFEVVDDAERGADFVGHAVTHPIIVQSMGVG